jgi:hypothetical protein
MIEYVKSKDVHKTLRAIWDASLKPLGFKRCKVSVASYFRPRKDEKGFLRFWSQLSQWGDSWSGNSFTLNIDVAVDDPHEALGGSARFLGDLTLDELKEAEKITELVFKRKPKPPKGHWIYNEIANEPKDDPFWKSAFEKAFTYAPGKLKSGCDIWMEYFSSDDVTEWSEFLSPILPRLLDDREKKKT